MLTVAIDETSVTIKKCLAIIVSVATVLQSCFKMTDCHSGRFKSSNAHVNYINIDAIFFVCAFFFIQ